MNDAKKMNRITCRCEAKTNPVKQGSLVIAKVPQGYETNINIRLVPGRDIEIGPVATGCRSRAGAPRREAEPLSLPPDLVGKLKDADKAVVAWLAKDESNAQLFVSSPAKALVMAGVDLSRADQKAIDRTYREVAQASVVAPGVKVVNFTAKMYPRSRIGKIKPKGKPGDGGKNTGCVKEE